MNESSSRSKERRQISLAGSHKHRIDSHSDDRIVRQGETAVKFSRDDGGESVTEDTGVESSNMLKSKSRAAFPAHKSSEDPTRFLGSRKRKLHTTASNEESPPRPTNDKETPIAAGELCSTGRRDETVFSHALSTGQHDADNRDADSKEDAGKDPDDTDHYSKRREGSKDERSEADAEPEATSAANNEAAGGNETEKGKKQEGQQAAIAGNPKFYYTDNIAAACAATNNELSSNWGEDGGYEKAARARTSLQKGRKTGGNLGNQDSTADALPSPEFFDAANFPFIFRQLQQENLELAQENTVLKQSVERLSNMLEMAMGTAPSVQRGEEGGQSVATEKPSAVGVLYRNFFGGGRGMASSVSSASSSQFRHQNQQLSVSALLQAAQGGGGLGNSTGSRGSSSYESSSAAAYGATSAALSSNTVASLRARRYQQQHKDQHHERLVAMAAAAALGTNGAGDANPTAAGSNSSFGGIAALLGGANAYTAAGGNRSQSMLLAQFLANAGGAGGATTTSVSSRAPPGGTSYPSATTLSAWRETRSSELQRYLAESRGQGRRASSTSSPGGFASDSGFSQPGRPARDTRGFDGGDRGQSRGELSSDVVEPPARGLAPTATAGRSFSFLGVTRGSQQQTKGSPSAFSAAALAPVLRGHQQEQRGRIRNKKRKNETES